MAKFTLAMESGAPAGLGTIGKLYTTANNRVGDYVRDIIVKDTLSASLTLKSGDYVYIFHVVGSGKFTLTLTDSNSNEIETDPFNTKLGNDHLPFNFTV